MHYDIVLRISSSERASLRLPGAQYRIIECSTDSAVRRHLGRASLVVCEVSPRCCSTWSSVRRAARALGHAPLVVRTELGASACRHIVQLSRSVGALRVSLVGFDDLSVDIEQALAGAAPQWPTQPLLNSLDDRVDETLLSVLTTAVVVARRRISVRTLARHCGTAARTLEWRLRERCVLPPNKIIAFVVLLHAAWQIDMLGWPRKRVLRECGFSSDSSFANYVRRHMGCSMQALMRQGGYEQLLESFTARLRENCL